MRDLADVNVAILAGGLGTRLAPILPGQQKVVAKVKEHPFLEYVLNQLSKAGFKNVVMCIGHLGDQVQEVFGDNYGNLSLSYSKERSLLGTAGAIKLALPLLKLDNILVTNGDTFLDSDLKDFLQFHIEKGADGTILLTEVSDTARYGKIEVDKNGQIIRFQEKKESGGAGLINGGIYLFKRSLLIEIPEDRIVYFESEMFPSWISKRLYGFKSQGRFIDIGTPESYKEAEEFFSQYPI